MKNKPPKPKIIFVYNADSGVFNLIADMIHKLFSPQTYACNLCAITHSNFGMKKEWKEYLETLENPLEFLHSDEFKGKYKVKNINFPAIFIEEDNSLKQIAHAEKINDCRSVQDLESIINSI